MAKRTPGIRRHGHRWEVTARVNGELHRTSFPLDTPVSVMQQWRLSQRTKQPPKGSLASDIEAYLHTVKHMPSYSDRHRDLMTWEDVLGGHRSRSAITTAEIDAALSTWLAKGYSPTTVRHRRTALLHLYNRLDGKDVPNPVRRSQNPREPAPQPRYIPPEAIRAIIRAIPGRKTRCRLRLMATTGLPQKLIGQLTPESIDGTWLRVPARRKGRGAASRMLPLSHQAIRALQAMAAARAWGPFSHSSFHKAFRLARTALGYPKAWRPYDVRHSVGAWLYEATGDLATVARLLGVRSQTAQRYAASANAMLDQAAMRKAGDRLAKVVR